MKCLEVNVDIVIFGNHEMVPRDHYVLTRILVTSSSGRDKYRGGLGSGVCQGYQLNMR